MFPDRPKTMRSIRSRGNRSTEVRLALLLEKDGIQGWVSHARVAGSFPDFSFPSQQLAIYVDGCFWHSCPIHSHPPAHNKGYWVPKLAGNKIRDSLAVDRLARLGWRSLRIWEHELSDGPGVIEKIKQALASPRLTGGPPGDGWLHV
jgi:DNA mismatch endonuclease, patch repair protein